MYKIEKIILDGYKRLKLGQIGHIEIDFNARDQIIIGTNGCGKSSIFHELSALPADKAQFEKTGKKEIHIRKDGKSIVATTLHRVLREIYDKKWRTAIITATKGL